MISIIIPTLNEEEMLTGTLKCIAANNRSSEIIIVDGGSDDRTTILAENTGARVIHSSLSQRAAQMNCGAHEASCDFLLFLHADTHIPVTALECVEKALMRPNIAGGAFTRRFDHPSVFLKATCRMSDIRSTLLGWHFGDQGIFVKKSVFDKSGGFHERSNMEDLEFSRRLKRHGKVVTLKLPLLSSGRRFGRNPIRRTFSDLLITLNYLLNK